MKHTLFVGGLSWSTRENSLQEYLGSFGSVLSVKVPVDRMTQKPRGFAFVEVGSMNDASSIINGANDREFEGRVLRISVAREEETEPRKLYVSGLSPRTTDAILKEHLSQHGIVESVAIVHDKETGKSRGFAFVDTGSENDSESIIQSCNGSALDGSMLLVRKSRPKPETKRSYSRHA